MEILKFLKETISWRPGFQLGEYFYDKELEIRPRVKCKDGFEVSIQGSRYHYCSPRVNLEDGCYSQVELGYPSEIMSDEINQHAENDEYLLETVYSYVPIELVEKEIQKHGGIDWEKSLRGGR